MLAIEKKAGEHIAPSMEGLLGIKLDLQLRHSFIVMEREGMVIPNKIELFHSEKAHYFSHFRPHIILLIRIENFRSAILLVTLETLFRFALVR